jgi:hypothetical protein
VLAAAAAAVLILIGATQLIDNDPPTVTATVDEAMPRAGGSLEIEDESATLHLHGMPDLGEQSVYQVWLQHDDRMVPARTFEIGPSGRARWRSRTWATPTACTSRARLAAARRCPAKSRLSACR